MELMVHPVVAAPLVNKDLAGRVELPAHKVSSVDPDPKVQVVMLVILVSPVPWVLLDNRVPPVSQGPQETSVRVERPVRMVGEVCPERLDLKAAAVIMVSQDLPVWTV